MSSASITKDRAKVSDFGLDICSKCEFRFNDCPIRILDGKPVAQLVTPSKILQRCKCVILINRTNINDGIFFHEEVTKFLKWRQDDLFSRYMHSKR